MLQRDVHSYLTRWLAPLEGDTPCGKSLVFEPEFEALQEEAGRDNSIHADRPTDWKLVLEQADDLLSQSKDLWLFSYGLIALYQTRGLHDCSEGISAFTPFLEKYWNAVYPLPTRLARRHAPLKWLQGRLAHYAEHTGFIGEPPLTLQACHVALHKLQSLLDTKIPDNDFAFDTVLRALNTMPPPEKETASEPEQKTAPSPAPAPTAPRKPDRHRSAAPLPSPTPDKEGRIPAGALPQIIRSCNDTTRQLGDHLLSINISDERAYMLHRTSCWSSLLQLPPVDEKNRTQIVCPADQDRIATYTTAIEEKRFQEIIPQIEKTASKAPFWLDGHYMVVRCLEGMEAAPAAACIKHALSQLMNRFPALVEYKFKDGTPFASSRTATWLDAVVQSTFAGPHSAHTPDVAGSGYNNKGGEELLLQQAISINAEKGFDAGLAHLGNVPPGRCRASIRHTLLKARYCLSSGKKNSAGNMLQNLFDDLEKWGMLDWEPKVSAAVISLLLASTPKSQQGSREKLLALLHKYNLAEALKLTRETS